MLVFGWWEETGELGGYPRGEGEKRNSKTDSSLSYRRVSHDLSINNLVPGRPEFVREKTLTNSIMKTKELSKQNVAQPREKIFVHHYPTSKKTPTFPVDFTPFQMQK